MKRAPFFLGIGLAMLLAVTLPAQNCLYKKDADAPVLGNIEDAPAIPAAAITRCGAIEGVTEGLRRQHEMLALMLN